MLDTNKKYSFSKHIENIMKNKMETIELKKRNN